MTAFDSYVGMRQSSLTCKSVEQEAKLGDFLAPELKSDSCMVELANVDDIGKSSFSNEIPIKSRCRSKSANLIFALNNRFVLKLRSESLKK